MSQIAFIVILAGAGYQRGLAAEGGQVVGDIAATTAKSFVQARQLAIQQGFGGAGQRRCSCRYLVVSDSTNDGYFFMLLRCHFCCCGLIASRLAQNASLILDTRSSSVPASTCLKKRAMRGWRERVRCRVGDRLAKHAAAQNRKRNPGRNGSARPIKPRTVKTMPDIAIRTVFNLQSSRSG